jgi:NAD(P)-dependent dehydrogenase (short-subunit alcohol dehydrogenase family)
VLADVDLSGNRAVVTGAASGIGVETARALASVGAAVVLAVRRPEAAERVAAGITESTGNKAVTVRQLDLADQTSVTQFVDGWEGPLHILVSAK